MTEARLEDGTVWRLSSGLRLIDVTQLGDPGPVMLVTAMAGKPPRSTPESKRPVELLMAEAVASDIASRPARSSLPPAAMESGCRCSGSRNSPGLGIWQWFRGLLPLKRKGLS
jgi:hypothetical protein